MSPSLEIFPLEEKVSGFSRKLSKVEILPILKLKLRSRNSAYFNSEDVASACGQSVLPLTQNGKVPYLEIR